MSKVDDTKKNKDAVIIKCGPESASAIAAAFANNDVTIVVDGELPSSSSSKKLPVLSVEFNRDKPHIWFPLPAHRHWWCNAYRSDNVGDGLFKGMELLEKIYDCGEVPRIWPSIKTFSAVEDADVNLDRIRWIITNYWKYGYAGAPKPVPAPAVPVAAAAAVQKPVLLDEMDETNGYAKLWIPAGTPQEWERACPELYAKLFEYTDKLALKYDCSKLGRIWPSQIHRMDAIACILENITNIKQQLKSC
jgi:hypothetical protein